MNKAIMALTILLLTVVGCGGGTEPGNAGKNAEQGEDDQGTILRTIVRIGSDGTPEIKTEQISRAQQRAEVAAREQMLQQGHSGSEIGSTAQALSQDSGCDPASLWLFDQTNQTGQELCLTGLGLGYLGDYPHLDCNSEGCWWGTWLNRVRSYWAGISPGSIAYTRPYPYYWFFDHFSAWQRVDGTYANSTYVNLCNPSGCF